MASGMGSGRAKGTGKGQGRGKGEGAMFIVIGFVIVLILLGLVKFVVGLVFLNDCPAESKIPKYIAGSGGAASVIDAIVGCIETFANAAENGALGVGCLMIEHLMTIIIVWQNAWLICFKRNKYSQGVNSSC
ncbi:uncharacterized protein LOC123554098 isoform X2 [Mercenaria mercenaria]|uniref:uncharacterized protein LOC123554098 isoform X2 n=1 Tax=Mercenaria mercenaria TaxID=6596 RepID=UPI00234F81D1|nr:uncharacterized protein LOC123554098 isoform X2 [Mercenaria mercenaria]